MKKRVSDIFAGVSGLCRGYEKKGFEVVLVTEYDDTIAASEIANHENTD